MNDWIDGYAQALEDAMGARLFADATDSEICDIRIKIRAEAHTRWLAMTQRKRAIGRRPPPGMTRTDALMLGFVWGWICGGFLASLIWSSFGDHLTREGRARRRWQRRVRVAEQAYLEAGFSPAEAERHAERHLNQVARDKMGLS